MSDSLTNSMGGLTTVYNLDSQYDEIVELMNKVSKQSSK